MKFAKKILVSALLASSVISGFAQATTNIAGVSSSLFALADRGVQLTLASTLSYFQAYLEAVHLLDPNGSMKVTYLPSFGGYVLATTVLGVVYNIEPTSNNIQITGNGTNHFETINGLLYFVDKNGAAQQLLII